MKFEFSRRMEEYLNIKLRENPSSGNRVVSCGQTDRQVDVTKPIVVSRTFASEPKNVKYRLYLYIAPDGVFLVAREQQKWALNGGKEPAQCSFIFFIKQRGPDILFIKFSRFASIIWGYYTYRQVWNKILLIFFAQVIYVFHSNLAISSHSPILWSLIGLCNRNTLCSLWRTNCMLFGFLLVFRGLKSFMYLLHRSNAQVLARNQQCQTAHC